MSAVVILIEPAIKDIESIYGYLEENVGVKKALDFINELETACNSSAEVSERGRIPRELERIDMFDYRQIISEPYRTNQVVDGDVYIFGIIHVKRNVQDVLKKRLFRGGEEFLNIDAGKYPAQNRSFGPPQPFLLQANTLLKRRFFLWKSFEDDHSFHYLALSFHHLQVHGDQSTGINRPPQWIILKVSIHHLDGAFIHSSNYHFNWQHAPRFRTNAECIGVNDVFFPLVENIFACK